MTDTTRTSRARQATYWNTQRTTGPFAQLKLAYSRTLALADRLTSQRDALVKSGKFTTTGIRDQMITEARDTLPPFLRLEREVARVRDIAKAQRANLKVKQPDPTDAAAAIQRMEIRNMVRAMPPGEAMKLVFADPTIAEAVVTAPAILSGLPEREYERLTAKVLEQQFPDELQELAELDEAVRTATTAIALTVGEVKYITGLNDHEFATVETEVLATVAREETPAA